MSPSGSRRHTRGTSATGRPFWRRASRIIPDGWNTEGSAVSLLSRIGGLSMFLSDPPRLAWSSKERPDHASVQCECGLDRLVDNGHFRDFSIIDELALMLDRLTFAEEQ